VLIAAGENNQIRLVAAHTGTYYGQQMTAGDIYIIAGGAACFPYCGDGGPATDAALNFPDGLTLDHDGNVIVADEGNNRVRMVAVSNGTFYGLPMTAGDIYTVAGDGTEGFSGDGGPAAQAELWMPEGAAFDGAGNLLIADFANDRIRVVAARSGRYYGQPMTAGDIYTVAGGGSLSCPSSPNGVPATKVALCAPRDVQTDAAGNLVITSGQQIRVVAEHTGMMYRQPMTEGDIYTVAGDGTEGFSGDGGPATQAELFEAEGVVVTSTGDLLFSDTLNSRIREVTP
jgi:sugar lactone lactonase YvrE